MGRGLVLFTASSRTLALSGFINFGYQLSGHRRPKEYFEPFKLSFGGALLMFNGYYDLPLRMSFFKIAESGSHVA